MLPPKNELAVIIPVYNEEQAIGGVLEKWSRELSRQGIDYAIHVYNDGSKDGTLGILNEAAEKDKRIVVHDKKNSGHGPTILLGYKENSSSPWIFHVDSDDEMGPESFGELWSKRNDYDFILGRRKDRQSPLQRRLISLVSRTAVWTLYGRGVWDVNSPYRLMRTEKLAGYFAVIPEGTFAPNVIISGIAVARKLRILECPVPHVNRRTGEVSIKQWKLLKAAVKSLCQTVTFRFTVHF